MRIGLHLPEQVAGSGVHGVDATALIAKKCGVVSRLLARKWPNSDSRAHGSFRLESPTETASAGVERKDLALLAADEYIPGNNGGLAESQGISFEAKSPFKFEARHISGGNPRHGSGLEAGVGQIGTPAVP